MNKKLLIGVISFSLFLIASIGATMALFSDQSEASNIIKMGKVDIETKEKVVNNGKEEVGVKNNGPNDCWVRLLVTIPEGVNESRSKTIYNTILHNGSNPSNGEWKQRTNDPYFYYSKPLKANEVAILYDSITISQTLNKDEMPSNWDIIVYAEGVQLGGSGKGSSETVLDAFDSLTK